MSKNPYKALEAIEVLVGSDFGLDMEMYLVRPEKLDKTQLKKRLRQAAKVITDIYIISHAEGSCTGGHDKWQEKKYEILKTNTHL